MEKDNKVNVEIKKLKKLDGQEWNMEFFPPASEEQIIAFERKNNISIPESYKEWLRFSDGGWLFNSYVSLFPVTQQVQPPVGYNVDDLIPNEYSVIGGFGSKDICYNKNTGKFFFYEYVEPVIYFDDFSEILAYIIDICTN